MEFTSAINIPRPAHYFAFKQGYSEKRTGSIIPISYSILNTSDLFVGGRNGNPYIDWWCSPFIYYKDRMDASYSCVRMLKINNLDNLKQRDLERLQSHWKPRFKISLAAIRALPGGSDYLCALERFNSNKNDL